MNALPQYFKINFTKSSYQTIPNYNNNSNKNLLVDPLTKSCYITSFNNSELQLQKKSVTKFSIFFVLYFSKCNLPSKIISKENVLQNFLTEQQRKRSVKLFDRVNNSKKKISTTSVQFQPKDSQNRFLALKWGHYHKKTWYQYLHKTYNADNMLSAYFLLLYTIFSKPVNFFLYKLTLQLLYLRQLTSMSQIETKSYVWLLNTAMYQSNETLLSLHVNLDHQTKNFNSKFFSKIFFRNRFQITISVIVYQKQLLLYFQQSFWHLNEYPTPSFKIQKNVRPSNSTLHPNKNFIKK
eukprot:TRINITY_DN6446_c0_g5_i2.p1 TRINITY_DN6446_c0_g5~~TRINITY_DN6446_c0_g5_i2.p1  ORF type:complete len:313 (+),score=-14.59 TRINITY_DN6446_c0_g5_i2:58-939(+)